MTLTKSQILLYTIIKKLGESDDKIKLAKFAYFADFLHYAFFDESISDKENLYQKRNFGPLSVTFNDDLAVLLKAGLIENNKQYHFKVKKDEKITLTQSELKTIDYVLNKYKNYSYDVLADITHKQVPYMTANDGGVIEYNTAYNLVDEYPDFAESVK